MKELEGRSYQQLKENPEGVKMIADIAAFRNLIKLHDRFKQKYKTEVGYKDVNRIIKEYCYCQGERQEELYQEMRRELINKEVLTANEFGEIFEMNETRMWSDRPIVRDTSRERYQQQQQPQVQIPQQQSQGGGDLLQ